MKNLKRQFLPKFQKLSYNFDIDKILEEFYDSGFDDRSKFNDLSGDGIFNVLCEEQLKLHQNFVTDDEIVEYESNDESCLNGQSYRQLSLTNYDESNGVSDSSKILENNSFTNRKRLHACMDKSSNLYVPEKDERNYTKRGPLVKGIWNDILNTFTAPVTRTRFAYMAPGFEIKPHIDYNTDYSIRVHIPILTNDESVLGIISQDGTKIEQHLPADGSVWFLNTGYMHYAANRGSTPRIHLIIGLNGQEDLN